MPRPARRGSRGAAPPRVSRVTTDTTITAGIAVDGVRRAFGEVQAVRHVTLQAHAGRVTGLVGPNGSGKTTLLLMLASLLAPDAGTIRIAGIDPVTHPHEARALIGWMPDALGAWGTLTSRETLVFTARLYGMPKPEASARAFALMQQVGLADLADAPARVPGLLSALAQLCDRLDDDHRSAPSSSGSCRPDS